MKENRKRKLLYFLLLLFATALFIPGLSSSKGLFSKNKKKQGQVSKEDKAEKSGTAASQESKEGPAGESVNKASADAHSAAPSFAPPPPADPAVEARVKELIKIIEAAPSGVVVMNRGQVVVPPDHQPYNPDGSRNQNFKVVAVPSSKDQQALLNPEQKKMQALAELIKIGRPAVDQLAVAVAADYNQRRDLYCYALGEIKDPRAVPALLKYFEDGKMRLSAAATYRSLGDNQMAARLEAEGKKMMTQAAGSLARITGVDYGLDYNKWRLWWEANKAKVGPTPKLTEYTANPPGPKVHYDPDKFKPTYPP